MKLGANHREFRPDTLWLLAVLCLPQAHANRGGRANSRPIEGSDIGRQRLRCHGRPARLEAGIGTTQRITTNPAPNTTRF